MSVVPSLLQAITRLEAEALVLHVGEKPFVVAPSGRVELASRALTFDAVKRVLGELLPAPLEHALEEVGSIKYELPKDPNLPAGLFTLVAVRDNDDFWAEIRRHRFSEDDYVPDDWHASSKT